MGESPSRASIGETGAVSGSASIPAAPTSGAFLLDPAGDPLAGLVGAGLNHPLGDARRDLSIVENILDAWRTNFPKSGNPVGLNRDITRALTGANPLRVAFVPADHPAINEAGELCDRWGTPLIFHQISGVHMELRSAGSDRIPYTEDDLIWNEAEPL